MKKYLILLCLLGISSCLLAQSADSLLNAMSPDTKKDPVVAFKSTRLILSQSTATVKKNTLNFQVIHRFGDFAGKDGGGQTDFGLDAIADVYIGFEYGLTDNLNIDIGRSTIGKLVNIDLKYAVLHETADNSTPVSLTLLGISGINTYLSYPTFSDRLSWFGQAIFSRQLFATFSLQIAPGYVSDNTPNPNVLGVEQSFFALSGAARLKVSKHMSVLVDYAHPFSSFRTSDHGFRDPLGFGIEIETGGHVFTLNITNARAIDEINYLSNTQSSFSKGQYRLGFTISRIFDFNHKSTYK